MPFYDNTWPSNYDEIKTFYPVWYVEVLEMDAIWKAEGVELDKVQASIEALLSNGFIETADHTTISTLERFLHIDTDATQALIDRRRLVASFFSVDSHIGAKEIKAAVSTFTDGETEVTFVDNTIHVRVTRDVSETAKLSDCLIFLKTRIPAHLGLTCTDALRPISIPNPPPVFSLRDLRFPMRMLNHFGAPVILLDGSVVLDGSWCLDQVFRGVDLWDIRFASAVSTQGQLSAALAFGALLIPNKERQAFDAKQVRLQLRFSNSPGGSLIMLDGQKLWDGSWHLDQAFRGVRFRDMRIAGSLLTRELLSESIAIAEVAARTEEQLVTQSLALSVERFRRMGRCSLSLLDHRTALKEDSTTRHSALGIQERPIQTMESASLRGGRFRLRITENTQNHWCNLRLCGQSIRTGNKLGGVGLTQDSMWNFDGTLRLNGDRKLNANIIKEDI